VTDSGLADARLAAALVGWDDRPDAASAAEVYAALAGARVFAAITATPAAGSGAQMAVLTLRGSAGGRALPAFLDVEAVVRFHTGARPKALSGPDAGAAALADGAVAVLLDPPGAAFVVTGAQLADLAAGRVPIAGTSLSSRRTTDTLTHPTQADPILLAALVEALEHEPVRAARLLAGPDGPVLGLVPRHPLDAAALAGLAARLRPRLGGALPTAGLDVALVGAEGPGLPVPLKTRRRGLLRRDR